MTMPANQSDRVIVDRIWLNEKFNSGHVPHCSCSWCEDSKKLMIEALRQKGEEVIKECSDELEKAFAECETLNLLHRAARVRALLTKSKERK